MPTDNPINTATVPSILSRAKRLGTTTLLALVPLAAQVEVAASPLTLDYSAAGQSTSSGWFVGAPDESKADGIVMENGFKLWGGDTLNDAMFWTNDEYYGLVPRYDFTGVSFIWGGKITGGSTANDKIAAPFDFSVSFTNAVEETSYSGVNVSLSLGYSYDPHQGLQQYQSIKPYNIGGENSYGASYSTAGSYHETGNISVNLTDTPNDLYWYALLTVDWSNEFNSGWYWNGNYHTLNSDTLTITIPQNSIDVTHVPGNAPGNVPDTGSTAALLGLALVALGGLRRR
jgi:hypothetical protein